jgi:hypothetical protein
LALAAMVAVEPLAVPVEEEEEEVVVPVLRVAHPLKQSGHE